MEEKNLKDILSGLAKSHDRPQTARIRDIFDDIEQTLKSGVARSTVLATLNEHGFNLSPKGFETILYRLRKERSRKEKEYVKTSQESLPNSTMNHTKNRTSLPSSYDSTKLVKPTDFDPNDLI